MGNHGAGNRANKRTRRLARERQHLKPSPIEVAVRGSGFRQLLDFQERISAIPGVDRVSINAIDNERVTLVVELNTESSPG